MSRDIGEQVYWEHEPTFLWDYLDFGVELRDFAAYHFREAAREPNETAQRLGLLSLFREMMTGFEDLSALLLGLKRRFSADERCPFQRSFDRSETPLFFTLVNYRETGLSRILSGKTQEECYSEFGFAKLIPEGLEPEAFLSEEAVEEGLRTVAWFIIAECLGAETEGVRPQAYNKIKHGGIVISDGRLFFPQYPPGPATIDVTRNVGDPATHPLTVLTLALTQERLEDFKKMIWLTKVTRKVLLALYLWNEYPELMTRHGVQRLGLLFNADMRNLITYRERP